MKRRTQNAVLNAPSSRALSLVVEDGLWNVLAGGQGDLNVAQEVDVVQFRNGATQKVEGQDGTRRQEETEQRLASVRDPLVAAFVDEALHHRDRGQHNAVNGEEHVVQRHRDVRVWVRHEVGLTERLHVVEERIVDRISRVTDQTECL